MIPGSYYTSNYFYFLGLSVWCQEPTKSNLNQTMKGLSLQQNCTKTIQCKTGLCCGYDT